MADLRPVIIKAYDNYIEAAEAWLDLLAKETSVVSNALAGVKKMHEIYPDDGVKSTAQRFAPDLSVVKDEAS